MLEAGPHRPDVSGAVFALVAAGGTAGHILPALAVAEALVERGHQTSSIHFVGSRRGLDSALVPQAGFGLTTLPGRGVPRGHKPADLARAAAAIGSLGAATLAAMALVVRLRPRVVLSAGGYASVPCSIAAALLGVPVVLVNVDSVPGAASRVVASIAKVSAVAFKDTNLPRAVLTGAPLRSSIARVAESARVETTRKASKLEARVALGLPLDIPVLLAFGGSLGAGRINRAIAEMVSSFWDVSLPLAVWHVVGGRDWPGWTAALGHVRSGIFYRAVEYEDRMSMAYIAADLAVCRAGAMTIAELAAFGLPALLVPLPGAPGDHQNHNARALVSAGAAELLEDTQCTGRRLAEEVSSLAGDSARLGAMGAAGQSLARLGAAEHIAGLLEHFASPARSLRNKGPGSSEVRVVPGGDEPR